MVETNLIVTAALVLAVLILIGKTVVILPQNMAYIIERVVVMSGCFEE